MELVGTIIRVQLTIRGYLSSEVPEDSFKDMESELGSGSLKGFFLKLYFKLYTPLWETLSILLFLFSNYCKKDKKSANVEYLRNLLQSCSHALTTVYGIKSFDIFQIFSTY